MNSQNIFHANPVCMMRDSNTESRHSWLAAMQRPARIKVETKVTLIIAILAIAFGYVSEMDYQDAIAMQEERDAYTYALARCSNYLSEFENPIQIETLK